MGLEHPSNIRREHHSPSRDLSVAEQWFWGGGAMGAAVRAHPWSTSALGPMEAWPTSLRTQAAMVMQSRFPMSLWWGPELIMLYNDGYVPVMGGKHPAGLGRSARAVWGEIWDILGPQAESVLAGSPATWNEHLLLPMNRKGFVEETYFTFSYSAAPDDSGAVGGILVTCQETTVLVQDDRGLETLRQVGARLALTKTAAEACSVASGILATNDADLPFGLLYLRDGAAAPRLLEHWGFRALPPDAERAAWPFERCVDGGYTVIDALVERIGEVPRGRWAEAPSQALCLPLQRPGMAEPYGYLVVGASPRRTLDARYLGFFRLVADQIASGIANGRAHEEERRRAEALAEIDRAKTSFFSNVSHEPRTPLTLMLGPTEDAMSTGRPLAGAELASVHRNELRLLDLVNALLEFSRMEAGRARACFEPTDLAELTRDTASAFRSAVERAGLELVVDCTSLSQPIWVDRSMWEKVLMNLLSNALKFTHDGVISVHLQEREGSVCLEVRDTGIGIPEAELPRMFERFHRVEGARGRTHEGSGLGLALVSEILRLHGARISVDSTLGEGTTFTVILRMGADHLPQEHVRSAPEPRAPRSSRHVNDLLHWLLPAEEPTESASEPASEPAMVLPIVEEVRGARVLLVDDNADMRTYLGRTLSRHWRVELAAHGAEALEMMRCSPPDLVLTDVMMPVLDGFGLIREMRRDPELRGIPVLVLSARAGEEARVDGLEAGADDYLVKPFSARELVARVATHLHLARTRNVLRGALEEADRARGRVEVLYGEVEEERKRLALVLEEMPIGVTLHDGEWGEIVLVNRAAREILGGEPVHGDPPEAHVRRWDARHPNGEPMLGDELPYRRAILTGRTVHGAEAILRRPSGDEVRIRAHAAAVSTRADAWPLVVTAFEDITEEARLRRELEQTARFAEEFVGIVGHDLRNPLNAIGMGASILRRRLAHPDDRRVVDRIASSVQRMSRMATQLLDLTRVRLGGGIPIAATDFDVSNVVVAVVDELRIACPDRRLLVSLANEVRCTGDADRLAQVVSNLVGNALQHGDPREPVAVSLAVRGGHAVLEVVNRGAAIPPEILGVLFEPFRRGVQEARSSGASGLGLGLYITDQIVRAHGGFIEVASSSSATSFRVHLPLAVAVLSTA